MRWVFRYKKNYSLLSHLNLSIDMITSRHALPNTWYLVPWTCMLRLKNWNKCKTEHLFQTFNATSAGFGKWKRLLWWPGWEEGWVTCNYSVLVAQIIPPLLPQKQNQKIQIFESIVKNEILRTDLIPKWNPGAAGLDASWLWFYKLTVRPLKVEWKGREEQYKQKKHKQKTGRWLPTKWAYRLKGRLCRSKRKVVGPNRLRFPAKLLFTRSVGWEQKSSSATVNWPAWSYFRNNSNGLINVYLTILRFNPIYPVPS